MYCCTDPWSSTQVDRVAIKTRLAMLSKDELLRERIWRTIGSEGASDSKMSLNDLLSAWKGVPSRPCRCCKSAV